MINAATNPKMLDNQLFHIHDSWDLDPIKARSNPFGRMFNTTQTACMQKSNKQLYEKKNNNLYTPFLVFCFIFDCRLLGNRDIDWPLLTEVFTFAVVFSSCCSCRSCSPLPQ